jgi:hypothetical protein
LIRVFIADDQLLIRQGIRTLLELDAGLSVVGEASDGIEATERVPALHRDQRHARWAGARPQWRGDAGREPHQREQL